MKNIFTSIKIWWYKQTHFEFFSIPKIYLPIVIFSLYQAIKMRDFYWLKYVNPNIYLSGITEHSKQLLLQHIPISNRINDIFVPKNSSLKEIKEKIKSSSLSFPLVIKPDCGSRGIDIYKVNNIDELPVDLDLTRKYVIQEMVIRDNEYGVFYIKYPNEKKGSVVSLVEKEYMKFIGDGNRTLRELIMDHDRAWLYLKRMDQVYSREELQTIIPTGVTIPASFVGSHSGGTIFHDVSNKITKPLSRCIDTLSSHIPEFYYGRYDIKADSIADIQRGNFKVLELNAAIGEPAHMYDPNNSIYKGYSILLSFWQKMATIAQQNKSRKISPAKKPV